MREELKNEGARDAGTGRRNRRYGPYDVAFMGAGVWAGIPNELPQELVGKKVWVEEVGHNYGKKVQRDGSMKHEHETSSANAEGARDASAQQDEREVFKNAMRARGVPADDYHAWVGWQARAAAQVQSNAAVGTAAAWIDDGPDGKGKRINYYLYDIQHLPLYTHLYTHPDPLLAECVEVLEYALPYLQAMIPNPRNGVNADCSTDVNCVARVVNALAKVQAAKGDKQ